MWQGFFIVCEFNSSYGFTRHSAEPHQLPNDKIMLE